MSGFNRTTAAGAVDRRTSNRIDAIEILGGKCARCGYSDWRALQFDHILSGGSNESTNTQEYINRVLSGHGTEFQLLCANCNSIKRYESAEGCKTSTNKKYLAAMERCQTLDISLC